MVVSIRAQSKGSYKKGKEIVMVYISPSRAIVGVFITPKRGEPFGTFV